MELSAWILILTLSGVLLLFLIIGIVVLVRLLQLINDGKQLVGKSYEIVDKTDQIVDNVKQIATVSGLIKLAFDTLTSAATRRKANSKDKPESKAPNDNSAEEL